jgi:hypothetical protein
MEAPELQPSDASELSIEPILYVEADGIQHYGVLLCVGTLTMVLPLADALSMTSGLIAATTTARALEDGKIPEEKTAEFFSTALGICLGEDPNLLPII